MSVSIRAEAERYNTGLQSPIQGTGIDVYRKYFGSKKQGNYFFDLSSFLDFNYSSSMFRKVYKHGHESLSLENKK